MNLTVTILTPDYIAPFRLWLCGKGRSENTARGYCSDVRTFFKESGLDSLPLDQLRQEVWKWMTQTRRTVSPATTRRRSAALTEFGEWQGVKDIMDDYKLPMMQQQTPHPLPGLND